MTVGDGQQTPSFEQVIKDGIEARMAAVNVSIPAEIVSYSSATQKCSVQPSIKRKYEDGTVINLPIINDVPVLFPRAGKAFISFPLKAGDSVLLIFSQRSLDSWLETGGIVEANDQRKHAFSDAIAIPGLYPFNDLADGADDTNIVVRNDKLKLSIKPDGKFKIENDDYEFVGLVSQLTDALIAVLTNTMLGPQPFINKATFVALKPKIDSFKE